MHHFYSSMGYLPIYPINDVILVIIKTSFSSEKNDATMKWVMARCMISQTHAPNCPETASFKPKGILLELQWKTLQWVNAN